MEGSLGALGGPGGSLEGPLETSGGLLQDPWGPLGGPGGSLEPLETSGGLLEDPWRTPGIWGALESRMLAENGSEMAENGAGKVSRRSAQAVAPSSPSMSPWGCMGNPFGTELVPTRDPNFYNFRKQNICLRPTFEQ